MDMIERAFHAYTKAVETKFEPQPTSARNERRLGGEAQ